MEGVALLEVPKLTKSAPPDVPKSGQAMIIRVLSEPNSVSGCIHTQMWCGSCSV
jgi:hypothetical protein